MADETGNSLTVLDTAANTVVTTLTGIQAPHNVQVGQDAATVYATSVGTDTVVAIDAETYEVRATAQTGHHPAHVIEAPNGKVYVANSDDGTVSVFERQSLQPLGQIELGGMPHGLRAAADGSVIVVANHMSGALDVIDSQTDQLQFSVPVGAGPAQVAVTADGRYVYTGLTEPAAVVKVDLSARKVVGSVAVSAPPVQVYLTPDDATVVSADQGTPDAPGHAVSLIDTRTMNVRATVATGAGPHGVVIDHAGNLAWVTNSYDNSVSVVDLGDQTASATIPVGLGPNGISFAPRPPAPGAPATELNLPAPGTVADEDSSGPPQSHHPGHR
ncbi:YVTN family beta-propeller repeat protein [Mycolicibacterium sp. XJ1819]